MLRRLTMSCLLFWVIASVTPSMANAAEGTILASNGRASFSVVIAPTASRSVQEAAQTLADYLEKMSGATFTVEQGNGVRGIAVGCPEDFPDLPWLSEIWESGAPTLREDYLLRSHQHGLYVISATERGVSHAVWDLLYRLGHRQFFPGPTWEIVPRQNELSLNIDVSEHPAFFARKFMCGFGLWDDLGHLREEWAVRNRNGMGIEITTSHAYDKIISRNTEEFASHPEYLALVQGNRQGTKLCVSNLDLQKLVVRDALQRMAENPDADGISMEPSDGRHWCECESCAALGSISDRALLLANLVAEKINEQCRGKYAAMYAYNAHSPPPSIKVHPQVVISVATSFIQQGYQLSQLLEGWRDQGATLGIRDFLAVSTWDRDLPGRPRGSQIRQMANDLSSYHQQGARFYFASASDCWGPMGVSYYLAARVLWNPEEADHLDALVDDFLDKSFESAREPMSKFYDLLHGPSKPPLSDDLIGRMYLLLEEARGQSDSPAVQRRLDDLVLYVRYLDLWFAYEIAKGNERQMAFEALIRHAYRMRHTMMVHSRGLYVDLVKRDKNVSIPSGAGADVPDATNPWKSNDPFSREELDRFLVDGVNGHQLRGFDSVPFGEKLVIPEEFALNKVPAGNFGAQMRGTRKYYMWIEDPSQPVRLTVTAGNLYQDRGPVRLTLDPAEETIQGPDATASVLPDKKPVELSMRAIRRGLYTLSISDGDGGTTIDFHTPQRISLISGEEKPIKFHGTWTLSFFVPVGTEVVGGFSSGSGQLLDGNGSLVHTFDGTPAYFRIPVTCGQDGKLWTFKDSSGIRQLLTVPPVLVRSEHDLLVPAELIQ